ncbi:IS200/IS605 family accessory protein TnpB-related protein [Streptomyces sp. NPDC002088]|uniref:IS200/IS605 family accessory protein TnpB-related protein n=1 Tax=Streptomyces sp. NPDC002088 TaxID=3154665 RepID=UPI00332D72B2
MSELASRDLAERVFRGAEHTNEDFARRKRELTGLSSSRWAGTITRGNNDQWALARRAQAAHLADLQEAISAVSARLSVPVAACDARTRVEGYPTQAVRAAKQRRLAHLEAEAARVRTDRESGRVRVVRGGRKLLHTRLHLQAAGLDEQAWRQRWSNARCRIEADGESGKRHGNQSIRITPDGTLTIKLPPHLAARYAALCDAHGRYTLDATCAFAYRQAQWRAQVLADRAVGYTIAFEDDRCYLTAAFTPARPDLPEGVDDDTLMAAARAGGVLGIDHNADHLAAWRLDTHGNPTGRPHRIDVDHTGSTSRRDAQVRHACSQLIRLAKESGATALVIEDLGFDTGREQCGWAGRSARRFRSTVAGMPVATFAARLVAMAHRAHLAVIIVDPAYSSRWGAQHWKKTTSTKNDKTSGHQAAAIVIGRRGQGMGARRRAEKTVPRKQTEAVPHARTSGRGRCATTHLRTGTEDHRPPALRTQPSPDRTPTATARPQDRAHDARRRRARATAQPAQHRSERATDVQTWTQDSPPLSVQERSSHIRTLPGSWA